MLESNATGLLLDSWRESKSLQEAPRGFFSSKNSCRVSICRLNVIIIKSLSNANVSIKNNIRKINIRNNAGKVAIWFHCCLCSNPCPLSGRKMTRPFRWEHSHQVAHMDMWRIFNIKVINLFTWRKGTTSITLGPGIDHAQHLSSQFNLNAVRLCRWQYL